eukprot:TRINITY_DN21364_c0_g1_i1.p1 TRINITY_DN21364_c0_g1~~TRINITY_DN21364_c0_g1_i1.p1  ORF type:complete len:215 (+),score=27.36 TRINITY_DN21364_c0_g1_i1:35-646(+)
MPETPNELGWTLWADGSVVATLYCDADAEPWLHEFLNPNPSMAGRLSSVQALRLLRSFVPLTYDSRGGNFTLTSVAWDHHDQNTETVTKAAGAAWLHLVRIVLSNNQPAALPFAEDIVGIALIRKPQGTGFSIKLRLQDAEHQPAVRAFRAVLPRVLSTAGNQAGALLRLRFTPHRTLMRDSPPPFRELRELRVANLVIALSV